MQNQRRRGDARETVANIGLSQDLADRACHARRRRPVPGVIPPSAKCVIARDRRRHELEDVEALLVRIRVHHIGTERLGCARLDSDWVVRRPQYARGSVHDHQAAHPIGMLGGQHKAAHPGDTGPEDRRLLASSRIHHREGIVGPERRPHHVYRGA